MSSVLLLPFVLFLIKKCSQFHLILSFFIALLHLIIFLKSDSGLSQGLQSRAQLAKPSMFLLKRSVNRMGHVRSHVFSQMPKPCIHLHLFTQPFQISDLFLFLSRSLFLPLSSQTEQLFCQIYFLLDWRLIFPGTQWQAL